MAQKIKGRINFVEAVVSYDMIRSLFFATNVTVPNSLWEPPAPFSLLEMDQMVR